MKNTIFNYFIRRIRKAKRIIDRLLAAPPVAEKPIPEAPPIIAQPAEEPADDSPVEDLEYEAVLAKLAEPETVEIDLAKEVLDLKDHFELAHSPKACRLQSDFDRG